MILIDGVLRIRRAGRSIRVAAVLIAASLSTVFGQSDPNYYLTQRYLGGLKINLTDDFTLTSWSAVYFGNGYYPTRELDKPTLYQGYDIVPGFLIGIGKIFGETKLSVGGDYYYLWRNWELNNDQPSIKQHRLRANFILSSPFCGKFNLTVTQRFERITQKKFERKPDPNGKRYGDFKWMDYTPIYSWMRFRTTFKISTPSFTFLKITPYISYEGFLNSIAAPDDAYYIEVEPGFSMSPFKGVSISFADQIQKLPQSEIPAAHQITINLFYTLDLSKKLAQMAK